MKLVAIIPAYNEEKTIAQVISSVRKYVDRVIVIDDGSKDRTYITAKSAGQDIVVLRHKINLGKGAAMKTGCEAALKLGAETMALIDADDQHSPQDLLRLLEKLKKENLDIVFGARMIDKNKMPLMMYLGNKFLTRTINALFKISVSDTQSGLKVFTRESYQKIKWRSSDYFVETEIIAKTANNNLKYAEVIIETIYKEVNKGTTIIDGIKVFLNILKLKFL